MAYSPFPPEVGSYSPSGMIDSALGLGPDASAYGTGDRGGIFVSPAALARMPEAMRPTPYSVIPGWFEGTTDWALPYLALGLDKFEADPTRGAHLWAAALKSVEEFYPERLASLAAAVEQTLGKGSARERILQAAERYARLIGETSGGNEAAVGGDSQDPRGFDLGEGSREGAKELRKSVPEEEPALTVDAPLKIVREQTRKAARRL